MGEQDPNVRRAIVLAGGNPDKLGCVMLEAELPSVYTMVLNQDWAYYSQTQSYIDGYYGDAHVTLLYGLMFSANEHQAIIDAQLEGWKAPGVLPFYHVSAFRGEDEGVPYSCLVLKPEERSKEWANYELRDANARLSKLPHVRGFIDYDPHVTIGYVQRKYEAEALEELRMVPPRPLMTGGLDYGD